MSTETLSRITMETMANYRAAATQVVAASGAGSRRLVRVVDGAVQTQVVSRATKLAPQAGERIDEVRGNVSRLVEQSIDQMVERAEAGIVGASDFATAQLAKLSDLAADVRNPIVAEGLHAAARLSLPAANLALVVSGKVAESATQLADVAGAHPVQAAFRKTAKRAQKGTAKARASAETSLRKASAQASKRTRKAVAEVVDAPVVKRARRAAKKAVA